MANLGAMDLLTYISDMSRRAALAHACNTSCDYLWQIATRWRGKRPSPELAALIEKESARLGPEMVAKEPMIFGPAPARSMQSSRPLATDIRQLVDSRISKRALRQKFGFRTDAHLAKVLGLPLEQVEGWGETDIIPALPQVMKLLGYDEQPAQQSRPQDPDADRIVTLEVA